MLDKERVSGHWCLFFRDSEISRLKKPALNEAGFFIDPEFLSNFCGPNFWKALEFAFILLRMLPYTESIKKQAGRERLVKPFWR
ncbi:MAG: hypothetical protein HUJ54_03430 [Erysipelotrichaceae bacterium]|nr:hypothetical protein [Erysipelotrichaceae bacterium]